MNDNSNIEIHRSSRYVAVPGEIFKNNEITLKAKGLYATIYSLPAEWQLSVSGLMKILPEGKSAIYAAFTELAKYGYVKHEQTRNERGQLSVSKYHVYDLPLTEKPYTDFQHTEKPHTENQPQYNNTNNTNSKENNSSSSRVREGFVSKGNMPAMTDIWMEDLKMFIFKFKGISLKSEQINMHYDNFKAQMNAQWTETHMEMLSEWKGHFANYLRKAVEIEGKRDTSTNTTYKGNINAGVEATNKMLEERKAKKPIVGENFNRWMKAGFKVDEDNNPIDENGNLIINN